MGKKKRACTCHECEVVFDVVIKTAEKTNLVPEICPFCGDAVDLTEERPLLKDFDQYDEFDDDKYYREDDDEIEDD